MPEALEITRHLTIPGAELRVEYSRSSGPGGQHVNKTETRVQLRFDLDGSTCLSDDVKARIRATNEGTLTNSGELLLACERFRSRDRNLKATRIRLAQLVRRCLQPPKKRKPTKTPRAVHERRLAKKKQRSEVKAGRQKVRY